MHFKFKYHRNKIISYGKILQSLSLTILISITLRLSFEQISKLEEIQTQNKEAAGKDLEPTMFFQNFTINLIMVTIAVEILSALIQIGRVTLEVYLDCKLTKRLKQIQPNQGNKIELCNMENDGFATKHIFLSKSEYLVKV